MDQIMYQHIHSFDTSALKDMISRGQFKIEQVTSLNVVLQIRPSTAKAVPTRSNENTKLLESFFKMLEKAETYITKVMDNANPLQIRIDVKNSYSMTPESGKF